MRQGDLILAAGSLPSKRKKNEITGNSLIIVAHTKNNNTFSSRFRRRWLLAIISSTFFPGKVPSATPQPRALHIVGSPRDNERNQKVLSRAIHRIFQLA